MKSCSITNNHIVYYLKTADNIYNTVTTFYTEYLRIKFTKWKKTNDKNGFII